MSIVCFRSLVFLHQSRPNLLLHRAPPRCGFYRRPTRSTVRALSGIPDQADPRSRRWKKVLTTAASLYPLYVTIGGTVACVNPSAFSWFVKRGPASYSFSLGFIMLATGLTLELKDLFALFRERPFSILLGFVAQYTIMPAFGVILSKAVGLPPSLSVGLILLACCPAGTASNVVTLIARGDVPLAIVMTVCTTLAAVLLTPLLTKILAGTFVSVDAIRLSISTLQVVVAPVLLGSYLQSAFPAIVKAIIPFAPLLAVLASSLLSSSVFSENVVRFRTSTLNGSGGSDIISGDMGVVILAVFLLHFAGFLLGYLSAAMCGMGEKQRRAISIEVGMQNCSLGVVLATSHFSSPLVALPPALSAIIMNIMGSSPRCRMAILAPLLMLIPRIDTKMKTMLLSSFVMLELYFIKMLLVQ
ncbi:unnamed protein product [Musa banksii]